MSLPAKMNNILWGSRFYLLLVLICAGSVCLALPTINNNIDNPNLIVYFNHDEGYLMDLGWSYYSGEKRASYYMDFDYGLELLYLSDLARLIFSKFINFTPGTFVLILRWLHLISWIGALIAVWYFVGYHFARGWPQVVTVLLSSTRPAFSYLLDSLKPEPLVLLIMIIGLHYSLRVVAEPSKRNLLLAVACASMAFILKFAGIFLLPAIVAAMYFSQRYQNLLKQSKIIFPRIRISWLVPAFLGLAMIMVPLAVIMFYVRKSTGGTWFEQYGIWQSLLYNRSGLYSFLTGIFFILVSFTLSFFSKTHLYKKNCDWITEINSYALIVLLIFLGLTILFGFRWILSPKDFILAYAFLGTSASATESLGMISTAGMLHSFFYNMTMQIKQFDVIIIILFLFYLGIELYVSKRVLKHGDLKSFKRLVLLVFLMPSLIWVFSLTRVAPHHILPFFVAMVVLVVQGINMFISTLHLPRHDKTVRRGKTSGLPLRCSIDTLDGRKLLKFGVAGLASILLIIDAGQNGAKLAKLRFHQFNQQDDIAFELAQWWDDNISIDTKIVADHYIHVYIPPGYKNIKTLNWNGKDRVFKLRQLVGAYRPQFVYLNLGLCCDEVLPPIEEVLPDKRVRLVKSFSSSARSYQRRPADKFVIYEISY